jgi:aminomethyltransferase
VTSETPGGATPLRHTPLHDRHQAARARLVPFAGWEMPISYRGILEEHRAVRACAGLFDVSHMGEIELAGPRAAAVCQELTANDVRRLEDLQAQYSLLCNEAGGIIDDVLLYRRGPERYLLCVNAANTDIALAWIREHNRGRATVIDRSAETALVALQGPRAVDVLERHASVAVRALAAFGCAEATVAGVRALVSRTGYTGDDGFELFVAAEHAGALWDALCTGEVVPAGLGARDTLRLEAGLPLHGEDIGPETSALEAGLGWVVKLDKGPFIGAQALAAEARRGPARRLVGLALCEPGVPRHGCAVVRDGRRVGTVTSGTFSPMLGKGIAMGYVERGNEAPGVRASIEIRGRLVAAEIVRRPFYRRPT